MIFKSVLFSLGLLFAISVNQQARANVVDFQVSGTFPIAGAYSGTVKIDVTSGQITAADIALPGYSQFNGQISPGVDFQAKPDTAYFQILNADNVLLQLAFTTPGGSLVGFAGGSIFEEYLGASCGGFSCEIDSATGSLGTIAAIAAVPGPLVGAGLPGLVMAFGGLLLWSRRNQATAA